MIESASIFAKKCESSRIEAFRSLEADGWLTPRRGNSPSGRLIRHITQLNTAYFADGRPTEFLAGTAHNLFRPSVNSILVPQGSIRNASARASSGFLV